MAVPSKSRSSRRGSTSRRGLLKWGIYGLGAAALTTIPGKLMAQAGPKTLSFAANDAGILNFALLLEELEAAFYAAVIRSGKIIDPKELDYMQALGAHEASHVDFLREVLADQATFATQDLSFNQSGLAALLTNRDTILNTAVTLEDTGVHAYNGAGPSLTNPTYLLAAGSIVSVEGRHAAGARALLKRPVTEPTEDRLISNGELVDALNPFKDRAYDELYTPKQIVAIVGSLNVLNNPISGSLVA